jgi:peptidyl-tRNA hydrolase, PTH1 family
MKLIVGLGNPGQKYEKTRHNAGFAVLRRFAERNGLPIPSKSQYGSHASVGFVANEKCILALPQSFMNRSGQPVASLMGYYSIPPEELIVVHDELALDFDTLRCKRAGGHGGHNGLRDIIRHIGASFIRVRVGIGSPPAGWDTSSYVLAKWKPSEQDVLSSFIDRASDAIESIVRDGIDAAMNHFNVRKDLSTIQQSPSQG